jgi:hypothetical protein
MGSLIPSEQWDWSRDWPKVVVAVAATILFWVGAAAVIMAW